jgi:deoxyribodipyrimidine photo-lyase
MRAVEAQMHGFELGHDYPAPLVDLERAARHARQTLYALRDSPEAQQAAAHMLPRLSNPRKPHHKPDAQSNQLPLG